MKPIIQQIVEKLLPNLVRQSLAAHISEQIEILLAESSPHTVEIVVSPGSVKLVEELLADKVSQSVNIVPQDGLADGQAFLRSDAKEREINLDTIIDQISETLDAFFHEVEEEKTNE